MADKKKNGNKKIFIVDGIMWAKNDAGLVMQFNVGGRVHQFKITHQNGKAMAEGLQEMYLESN